MDWRQLHRGRHLLGAWGSAHQDEGISATGVGCFWLQFPPERAEAVGLGPVLGEGCVQVALPIDSSCYLVSGGWASEWPQHHPAGCSKEDAHLPLPCPPRAMS